jgi:hypothetical protein
MRSEAELDALLKSISTLNPALVEGKPPPPLLGEPRVVQSLRPAVIPFLTRREGVRQHLPTVFLDDPRLDEEGRRQVYAVLARIPWLHKRIRTAIRKHGLGLAVGQNDRATYKLQTSIFEEDIKRYRAAGMSAEAAFEKLSAKTHIDVDTLKRRMHPRKPRA